jgi:hypothetical protein
MEFRSVQGMERLRPQQDGMVVLLVVVVGMKGDSRTTWLMGVFLKCSLLFCVVTTIGYCEDTGNTREDQPVTSVKSVRIEEHNFTETEECIIL